MSPLQGRRKIKATDPRRSRVRIPARRTFDALMQRGRAALSAPLPARRDAPQFTWIHAVGNSEMNGAREKDALSVVAVVLGTVMR